MRKIIALCCFCCVHALFLSAQSAKSDAIFLSNLLKKNADKFPKVAANPAKYRVQILYTQIDRDAQNVPHFKSFRFRVNPNEYFYPASTVKFPATLLALEKLNDLAQPQLDRTSTMWSESDFDGQIQQRQDTTAENGKPSIEHYVKKILLVSDNDAFNRLYEWVGQEAFNDNLYRKGFTSSRIVHRLSVGMNREQNRRSNPIRFFHPTELQTDTTVVIYPQRQEQVVVKSPKQIWQQPMLVNPKRYEPDNVIQLGKGVMSDDGKITEKPFDFTYKNYFPIEEQQGILRATLFPEVTPKTQRFRLTDSDYKFLYQYMSQSPQETSYPKYDTSYNDSYCKFLMFGDNKKPMPKHIRIFNKVGDAYGFLIDNAYIVDFEKKIEFLVTATIYCNEDEIFNDDKYEYETIGLPFLGNLGRLLYDYEAARKRTFTPDLTRFQLKYDHEK